MKTCDAPRCGWDTETPFGGEEQPFCLSQSVAKHKCFVAKHLFPGNYRFVAERVVANARFFKKQGLTKSNV